MDFERPKSVSLLISTYNWKEALELVLLNLFTQTILPDEVIIADDGSRNDTKELIDRMREQSPFPLVHVWQKDEGFMLSTIRNKGIAAAKSEYIIQIDGDCVPNRHFVEDHLEMAMKGFFVCSSRVYCSEKFTKLWFETKKFNALKFRSIKGSIWNIARIGWLRRHIMPKFNVTIKGSNMAFWRKDLIAVNGYDEDYVGWGYEDNDLVARLANLGIKRRTLKMGGVMFHLYHKENERPSNEEKLKRDRKISKIELENITYTKNGIDKYL